MKLDELKALRDKAKQKLDQRQSDASQAPWKIVVSMGTSGILYGAREILKEFLKQVEELDLHVLVTQSGSFGLDNIEPLCAIYHNDQKVVYGNLKPDMIRTLLEKHIVQGEILSEYRVAMPGDAGYQPTEEA